MATQLELANMALSHIGSQSIANISPSSQEPGAKQANLWMATARDFVLRAYPWTFATLRKRLIPKVIPTVDSPAYSPDWTNYYFYPCECVMMQYIVSPELSSTVELITNTPFAVEKNPSADTNEERQLLLCNVENASAVFTSNDLAWEDLPANFIEPFTILLASYMAFPVTNDLGSRDMLKRLYDKVMPEAAATDARQVQSKIPQESSAIRGRR